MLVIFQFFVVAASAGTVVYAFSCWGQLRYRYYALLCVAVTFYSLGYFFEMTSSSLEGAITGCKVTYVGASLIGTFFYLFARDYSGKTHINRALRNVICLIPLIFVLAVFLYPWSDLYYLDLTYAASEGVARLVVTPGPLYYPNFAVVFILSLLGAIELIRAFLAEKRYSGAAIYFIAVGLPLVSQVAFMLVATPYGWNPMPTVLVASALLVGIFLKRYRQVEWLRTGRDQILQHMPEAFLLVDGNGSLIDFNAAAARYFPCLSEPWANKRTPKPILTVEGFPLDALAEDGQLAFEHKVAEETLSLRATSSPLILEGRRIGTSVVISDETEYHRLLEELTHLARRDTLTGLNNRATFFNDAALSFDLIGREGGVPGCALMLDIDFFKEVNDTYGHSEGDDVLRYIGKVLLKRFRHTDICGRYGGEEFCVWMPATSLANASKVAEEIRGIVQKHSFKLHCGSYSISVSIGIASSVDAAPGDFEDLMRKADIALYEAKNTGRNRVCIYNEDSMLANRSRGADAGNEEEEASAEGGGIA